LIGALIAATDNVKKALINL